MTNILLVEPNEALRDILWETLESAGYVVISAQDFSEGKILLETGQWDVLLTAISRDGIEGPQLAESASALGIPTIFIADNIVKIGIRHKAGSPHGYLLADLAARVRSITRAPASHAA